MTIRELVNTCQNQWSDRAFNKNSDFKFDIVDMDEDITYHFDINYLDNDNWYSLEHNEINYWRWFNGVLIIGFSLWRVI